MTSTDPRSISTKAEFGAGLTALRKQADLSIRDLAKLIDVPSATLGGWCSGRNLPLPGQLSSLRKAVNACGVMGADADVWLEVADRVRGTPVAKPAPRPASPYPGLTSFDIADAAVFFGREDETTRILDRLAQLRHDPGPSHGILAVVGASGSGKTSLLRAGVAAYLATLQQCTYTVRTPGTDPLTMLANARDELGPGPAVLVVDQFEELFTATTDPDTRTRFLTQLTQLAPDTLVVIGMRADFYAAAAGEAPFVSVLQHGQLLLEPLGSAGLRDAVQRPAEAAGVKVENGLIDLVMADLAPRDSSGKAHDAGALPLLSHALRAAWERGDGAVLTIDDYRAADGIDGAIARTAEEAFETVERQDDARSLFLRLVNIDNVAVTRRRVSGGELIALREAGFGPVIDEFVSRRLITVSADSIEISHEALLSAWPRLRAWIDEDRIGLKLHRQVTEAANAWEHAGRDDTLLLRGTRLDTAADLAERPTLRTDLTRLERTFVAAGLDARDAANDRARRSTRRLRRLLATVVVLFLVAAGLAAFAFRSRSTASAAERDASAARDTALSGQIAAQARQLRGSDPALSQQLALAAYREAKSDDASSALVDQSSQPTITRVLGALGPTALAQSADGRLIAVSHADDGTVHLYDNTGATPRALAVIPAKDTAPRQVFALRFSPDGRVLALGGEAKRVRLWDVSNPRRPAALSSIATGFTGDVQVIDFSPDGSLLAVGSAGTPSLRVWTVRTPATPVALPTLPGAPKDATVYGLRFAPDGAALVATDNAGTLYSWRVRNGAVDRVRTMSPTGKPLLAFAWTSDSRTLFVGTRDGRVVPVDAARLVATRTPVTVTTGNVNTIDVSRDSSRFLVGSSDTLVSQWSAETWTKTSEVGNPGPVTGAFYSPDDKTVLNTAADGTLHLYPADSGIPTDDGVYNLGLSRDGSRLAMAASGEKAQGIRIWDVSSPATPRRLSPLIRMPAGASENGGTMALRPDGMLVAGGSRTGEVVLFDITDPARPRPVGPILQALDKGQLVEGIAFTPNGRLMAVGGDDGTTRIFDVADTAAPRQLARLTTGGFVLSVALSGDGRTLAAASVDGYAYVWNITEPQRPRRIGRLGGFSTYVSAVGFDDAHDRLAVGSADHTTRLYQLDGSTTPKPIGSPLIGPSGYVYAVTFTRDGTQLATASTDQSVRVYDVDGSSPARTPRMTLRAVQGNVFAVAYTPDGRRLFGAGRSESVAQWTLDLDRYDEQLCSRAGNRITRDEWAINVAGAAYAPPCP